MRTTISLHLLTMLMLTQPLIRDFTMNLCSADSCSVRTLPRALPAELVPFSSTLTAGHPFPELRLLQGSWCACGGHITWHTRLWGAAVPTVLTWQEGGFTRKQFSVNDKDKNCQCFSNFTYASHEVYSSNTVVLPWILINFTMIISCFQLQSFSLKVL